MASEIEFTSKKQGLTKLHEIFKTWNEQISNMDDQKASTISIHPLRSIKDDIAHLWEWQRISVARLEAALYNYNPIFDFWPKEFYPSTDENDDVTKVNEWIFESNKDRSWSDVYKDWYNNFTRLIDLTELIDESVLLDSSKFSWLAGYPLIAVLYGTYGHHTEHFEKFAKLSLK